MESNLSIFEEEYKRVAEEKSSIILTDVLKMNLYDDENHFKINFLHIPTLFFLDEDKDGKFKLEDFIKISRIYFKEKDIHKEYEFTSRLQAYFTLLMWKQVCSKEGENNFVQWVKTLITETQLNKHNDSEEEINIEEPPIDLKIYIDKYYLRIFYDIMNVKLTHGIDFQTFFDLLQSSCLEMGLMEDGNESLDNYIHIDILDIFSKYFVRGFSRLLIDIGFDSILLDEIQ